VKKEPEFKKGDRCIFVYTRPNGKEMELDDNMIIDDEEPKYDQDMDDWYYPIKGKSNGCIGKFLKLYNSK